MKYLHVLIVATLLAAGCSSSESSRAARDDGDKASAEAEQARQADEEQPEIEAFAPQADEAKLASFAWAEDGELHVGYADGTWARIDPKARQGSVERVLADRAAVRALSPSAKLALVVDDHPVVVRLRDGQAVLRMRDIAQVESLGFFPGGGGIYVAASNGDLHIWNSSESDLDEVSTKNLKDFMGRQSSEFTAKLSPLRGTAQLDEGNRLFVGTHGGKVLRWDPREPARVDALVQLPAEPHTFGYARSHLVATTASGDLRVVDLADDTFVAWSIKEQGDWVAASPKLRVGFAVTDASTIGLRAFQDGTHRWKAELPDGQVCGLALSPDASQLAVCLDSAILLLDPKTGEELAALRRDGETIEWRD
ncbi:MAG: WD40 repeat domain-containing protein [Persicimonas sp.]